MLGAHLLTEGMGEGNGHRSPPRSGGSPALRDLHDPTLAQLVAEVSSDLSVLRGELSVGPQAPPLL